MDIKEMSLCTYHDDVVVFNDKGYDNAIIGMTTDGRAVYSYEKMVASLIEEGMDDIEAIDYIEYNTIRALCYIDKKTEGRAPIIMYSSEWLGF